MKYKNRNIPIWRINSNLIYLLFSYNLKKFKKQILGRKYKIKKRQKNKINQINKKKI